MPGQKQPTVTLAALIETLKAQDDVPAAKAKLYISAINRFCKVVDRLPSDTLADPAIIRKLAGTACWHKHMKKSSWATVRSNLNAALAAGGVQVLHRSRRNYRRSEAWNTLLSGLSARSQKFFTRFPGWCTSYGIEPDDVTEGTFTRFLDELLTLSTAKHPKEAWHRARRIWNSEVVPWSGGRYPVIENVETTETKTLPWSDFPEGLRDDIERYAETMAAPDWTDEDQEKFEPLSPATIRNYAYHLRLQLSLLVKDGVPIETFQSLADCLQLDLINRGLKLLEGGRGHKGEARPMLWGAVNAYLSFAKFSGAPEAISAKLGIYLRKLRDKSRGLKRKNRERLAQFDDPRRRRAFFMLPLVIEAELASVKNPTREQALRMRGAAMLELLLHMPIRIRNVVDLDLERYVQRVDEVDGLRWRIGIPEDEVKNGIALSGHLPVGATRVLELWRTRFRPRLNPQCTRLFIGDKGRSIGEGPLSKAFSDQMMRELGVVVNPHLMRHFATTNLLKARPGSFEQARQMLGHTNIATTINFYCGEDMEAALAQWDAIVDLERGDASDEDEL
ncbi:tyrosine-type recombinase/integrase [Glycocaulis sp.]|uniref:tyrosine-type recombinase/integrase n=1 Tax=Glycocaulis sp. TaxID=1969725 RepID=UPI003D21050D